MTPGRAAVTERPVEVCVDPFGGCKPARLCGECSGARCRARNTVLVVGPSSEAGAPCDDCGARNPERTGSAVPYLIGMHADDGGEGPLGGVWLERLTFPLPTYAECAHQMVTFPDERSLLRWAHKQFLAFEIGLL